MANLSITILKVRRSIRDWNPDDETDYIFHDQYYIDSIEKAIGRLNTDLNTTYEVCTLPNSIEWVLLELAQIEMLKRKLQILTGVADSSSSTAPDTGSVTRTEVPGLEIWYGQTPETKAEDYMDLIKDLENRYQRFLDQKGHLGDGVDLPSGVVLTAHRRDLSRGGAWTNYAMDEGLSPPENVALDVVSSGISITWDPVYHNQFCLYKVQRKLVGGDYETLVRIQDNHTVEYIDEEILAPGCYVYRVVVQNLNSIETNSAIAKISVA